MSNSSGVQGETPDLLPIPEIVQAIGNGTLSLEMVKAWVRHPYVSVSALQRTLYEFIFAQHQEAVETLRRDLRVALSERDEALNVCELQDRNHGHSAALESAEAQLLTVTEEREAMQRRAEAAESDWKAAEAQWRVVMADLKALSKDYGNLLQQSNVFEAERDALRLRLDAARHDAFVAGYHCQWIRAESRYIFDSMLKPGDPEGAFAAWLALPEPKEAK